jgi:hypothetical protein
MTRSPNVDIAHVRVVTWVLVITSIATYSMTVNTVSVVLAVTVVLGVLVVPVLRPATHDGVRLAVLKDFDLIGELNKSVGSLVQVVLVDERAVSIREISDLLVLHRPGSENVSI